MAGVSKLRQTVTAEYCNKPYAAHLRLQCATSCRMDTGSQILTDKCKLGVSTDNPQCSVTKHKNRPQGPQALLIDNVTNVAQG